MTEVTAAPRARKRILLVTCGGTIACVKNDKGAGVVPRLTGEDLLGFIPEAQQYAQLHTKAFKQVSSSDMSIKDIKALHDFIEAEDYDGYIVTQGTDSIEETAFALNVLYQGTAPIVITGAMRHYSLAGPEGNNNLLSSVLVASHPSAENQGVLVVMNETVHSAMYVTKGNTSRVDAFESRNGPMLGYLSEDRYICQVTLDKNVFPHVDITEDKLHSHTVDVPILCSHSGDDGQVLEVMRKSQRFNGVIIEGSGGGHVSKAMAAQVYEAVVDMTVIMCTRARTGATYYNTYGSVGNEIELIAKGVVMAGVYSAIQARILLQCHLLAGSSREQISQAFALPVSAA